MLGKTQPVADEFDRSHGISASAAGRPDGRQKQSGDLGRALRRVTPGGTGSFLLAAIMLGLFPR